MGWIGSNAVIGYRVLDDDRKISSMAVKINGLKM